MTVTTSTADILSDLMIMSIPVILLNMSQLRLSQKLRILPFLCLNIFMVAFCLTRLAGKYRDPYGNMQVRVDWTSITLHMESSVAVLMGGVTAFRTVFASYIREKPHDLDRLSSQVYYRFRKFFKGGNLQGTSQELQDNKGALLTVPRSGGTLKGLRTFIRRHKREPGQTTDNSSWNHSVDNSMDSYHAFRKMETRDTGNGQALVQHVKDEEGIMIQVR